MRRWIAALLTALSMLVAMVPGVGAVAEWCEDDPPVTIVTPAGNRVLLHVTNYGQGMENLPYIQQARIAGQTVRAKAHGEKTKVEVLVYIPSAPSGKRFKTRSVISTGEYAAGTVYDESKGLSGELTKLEFTLDVK
ncbi:MAG: hypothetical protein M3442_08995 [Chloroflexota bacterium]|nr:hypothetical protein [Chloroflexota bacterium]